MLIDIGARGGMQNKWRLYAGIAPLTVVFVEPDKAESARLIEKHPGAVVVAAALGATAGQRTLYLTADPGCSSLLRPSARGMASDAGWRLAPAGTETVTVERADTALAGFAPDFLKIDTQGTEFEILHGFGALLADVCAIEVECELFPLYDGQPLLADVLAFLDAAGFRLVAMRPNGLIDGGIGDVNAFFVRPDSDLSARGRRLARTWRRVNRIPTGAEYSAAL